MKVVTTLGPVFAQKLFYVIVDKMRNATNRTILLIFFTTIELTNFYWFSCELTTNITF